MLIGCSNQTYEISVHCAKVLATRLLFHCNVPGIKAHLGSFYFQESHSSTRNLSFATKFGSRSTFTKILSPSSLNFRKCKNLSLCLPLTTLIEGEAVCFFVDSTVSFRVLRRILKFELTLKLRHSRQNIEYKLPLFQVNASSLYLSKHFRENIKFLNNGNFELDYFPDNHVFVVMDGGNCRVNRTSGNGVGTSFSAPIFVPTNQTNTTSISSSGPSVPPLHCQRAVRRSPIFGMNVVRPDLGENGQPVNIHLHYLTAYINIYSEVEAMVTSLKSKV